ncbi:ATP-binding protein [Haloferax namakaokahaiae]|uniref:histidine kinase n=1 Tax=Haloferax namakaokahaiae TaxID=1748331 RepID=A0ABD5ZDB8_9EURY
MATSSISLPQLYYTVPFSVAALVCFWTLSKVEGISDRDTRRGLTALLLTSGCWAVSHVGFLVAPSIWLKEGFYMAGLIVGFSTIGAWLYFCSAYTGRSLHRNRSYRTAAVAIFIAVVSVKLTNPVYHLYFTTQVVQSPFVHLEVQYHTIHWIVVGLSYALAFVGYFMLFELFAEVDVNARPLQLLVAITGLPVVLDILVYSTPSLIDITFEPLGVAVFAVGVCVVYLDTFEEAQLAGEMDDPVISLTQDDTIRDSNHRARELFPLLARSTGKPLARVLPSVAEQLETDDSILELRHDGSSRYFQLITSPVGAPKSNFGTTVRFADVTDREQYRRELERQNDRLDSFAGMVSHDLRNPLNVAQGRLELSLEEHGDLSNLTTVRDALDRMESLIEDILVLARQGQPVEESERIELAAFSSKCWEMVDTETAALEVEEDFRFGGSSQRLQRLFENIYRNAIEHGMPESPASDGNSAPFTVTVGPLESENGFFVADNGSGISSDERDDVFTSGYTTDRHGTGFGLAIVSEIVEAHGWQIDVTASESGGARFEISNVTRFAD